MNIIRSITGICSENDALYDHLTGRECLNLFADIKGISSIHIKSEIEALLEHVCCQIFISLKELLDEIVGYRRL